MTITLEMRGAVAVLTLDSPPVNALGLIARQRLLDLAAQIEADPAVQAVVLCGAGKLFVGGADITEFDKPVESPTLPDVMARIERSSKPWIAAIHGAALGGGLELALACRHRIVTPDARLSLPETGLGLIPGAGGTQRLPRLIGVAAAVPFIAEGKVLSGTDAVRLGLADRLAGADLLADALALAADLPPAAPASARPVEDPGADFWAEAETRIARSARGASAPRKALQAIRHGVEAGFEAGLAFERQTFLALRASTEARALRRLFFAERAATRPSDLRDVSPLPLIRVGVIGAGTMGSGIAAALRDAGIAVVLSERDQPALDRGMAMLSGIFQAAADKGRITAEAAAARLAGVAGVIGYDALADCDLVIEAVFEDIAVKRAVFADLSRICRADAVLATNTSYIDPRLIYQGLPGADRFLGIHFFSPANVMKLVEVVPVPETRPEVLATAFDLVRRLGKVPVRSGICDGFIGNRILRRYRGETDLLLREGVPPQVIDVAMRTYGYAMGPFEMQDMAGLDISFLHREAARAEGQDIPETPADLLVRAGRKGMKTGGGWYDYAPGSRRPDVSPEALRIIAPLVTGNGAVAGSDIADRLLAAMVDEGRQIIAEGIADSEVAIDLVEVLGYGFPRWRGGPMFAAAEN